MSDVKWYGDDLLKQIREATPDALFEGGEMLIQSAASRAPHQTNKLRESAYVAIEGRSTYQKRKGHHKEVRPPKGGAVAGFAMFYARFVEFGTKKKGARPFLRPAIDELKSQVGAEITLRIGRKLK